MIDDFHYEHPNWVSQPFAGGVQLQIEVIGKDFADVAVQTRLSEESKFVNLKSVFVEYGKPRIIAIDKYAEGQQFRIRLKCESRYVRIFKSDIASMTTTAAVSAISDRVKDLEEGNEPMVLHVDTNTGNLVQTGVSSGRFGVDYESGYLTFTPASN